MKRKKKFRKILFMIICLLLISIILFCILQIKDELNQRKEDADTFEELASMVQIDQIKEVEETLEIDHSESFHESSAPIISDDSFIEHDVSLLKSKNQDCIGWICIPGTALNYPVMHTPTEPQKYLRMNFYEKYSVSGVPFLDYRCSLSNGNLIIYGHNMKNGTMFATVKSYRTEKFLQKHPCIKLELEDGVHNFDIFAVVSIDKKDAWYNFINISSEDDFNEQIQTITQKALYLSGEKPFYGDRILTLSTCHKNMEIDRIVVIAKETNITTY